MVESSDGFAALRAEKDDFVAVCYAGNVAHVKNNLIHADAAHERGALAANQKTEVIAERARKTVAVAGGDEREAHGLGCNEGCVVADGCAGWNCSDACD